LRVRLGDLIEGFLLKKRMVRSFPPKGTAVHRLVRHRRHWGFIAALVLAWGTVGGAQASTSPAVQAAVVADGAAVVPGQTLRLGVRFTIAPSWHIYWQNPGEAGVATEVAWELPAGFEAGPLCWPVPTQFRQPGDITVYGYEQEVLLSTEVKVPKALTAGDKVLLRARVDWLACETRCVPGRTVVQLELPVAAVAKPGSSALFDLWEKRLPRPGDDPQSPADVKVGPPAAGEGESVRYDAVLDWRQTPKAVEWFAPAPRGLTVDLVSLVTQDRETKLAFVVRPLVGTRPVRTAVEPVIVMTDENGERKGVIVQVFFGRAAEKVSQ